MNQVEILSILYGLGYTLVMAAFFFWLMQLLSVILFDEHHFESHSHRLLWFLVVFVSFIFGAIWFFVWKRRQLLREATRQSEHQLEHVARLLQKGGVEVAGGSTGNDEPSGA